MRREPDKSRCYLQQQSQCAIEAVATPDTKTQSIAIDSTKIASVEWKDIHRGFADSDQRLCAVQSNTCKRCLHHTCWTGMEYMDPKNSKILQTKGCSAKFCPLQAHLQALNNRLHHASNGELLSTALCLRTQTTQNAVPSAQLKSHASSHYERFNCTNGCECALK
jgi:hypothetical protein